MQYRERMGIYSWNAHGNQGNVEKHGYSFQSAVLALEKGNPITWARPDVKNAPLSQQEERRTTCLARLNEETVKIVYDNLLRNNAIDRQIVSAHRLNEKKSAQYDDSCHPQELPSINPFSKEYEILRDLDLKQGAAREGKFLAWQQALNAELEHFGLQPLDKSPLGRLIEAKHVIPETEKRTPRLKVDGKKRDEALNSVGRCIDERYKGGAQEAFEKRKINFERQWAAHVETFTKAGKPLPPSSSKDNRADATVKANLSNGMDAKSSSTKAGIDGEPQKVIATHGDQNRGTNSEPRASNLAKPPVPASTQRKNASAIVSDALGSPPMIPTSPQGASDWSQHAVHAKLAALNAREDARAARQASGQTTGERVTADLAGTMPASQGKSATPARADNPLPPKAMPDAPDANDWSQHKVHRASAAHTARMEASEAQQKQATPPTPTISPPAPSQPAPGNDAGESFYDRTVSTSTSPVTPPPPPAPVIDPNVAAHAGVSSAATASSAAPTAASPPATAPAPPAPSYDAGPQSSPSAAPEGHKR